MDDSNEWELSKENVQPLRQGRKVASLTSALQHNPTDMQQIKDQRDVFESQLRVYSGDDPLEVWDSYIKWIEQNFPRGGKDGNLKELLYRCLSHFKENVEYKNDARFVHIWIKFANFMDDPLEIYTYMFDQNIGCSLTFFYEEWANFLESLGNTKKADTIYMKGISQGAQPLDDLRRKHGEFQMRVARGMTLQPRRMEEEEMGEEDQRTVLGRLKPDKKNRVGTTRTGTAKLGQARPIGAGSSSSVSKQQSGPGFQVYQDENAPVSTGPQQTGEYRAVPHRDHLNRENEQAPGVWTKARAQQRRGFAAAAAVPSQPAFEIHEDADVPQQHHVASSLVDNHALSVKKAEKPSHMLDSIKNPTSSHEIPMYCKEKVYCGTQEFSFEEIRALRYQERKRRKEQEEEQRKLAEQLKEMRLLREQFQSDLANMREEHNQLMAEHKQLKNRVNLSSGENSDVQPSPLTVAGQSNRSSELSQNTPSFGAPFVSAPSSASFNMSAPPSAPSSASFNMSAPPSANKRPLPLSNSSFQKPAATGLPSNSLNSSQRTPVMNTTGPHMMSSGGSNSGALGQSRSGGPTPEGSISKHSLNTSPTINMKEALQMVQGMYNATLDCDRIAPWAQEDTEMTEAMPAAPACAPVVVFDECQQKAAKPAPIAIFCDQAASERENRPPGSVRKGLGGRQALQVVKGGPTASPAAQPPPPIAEPAVEEELMREGTEFYPHYDVTLAAVGSQESFAAAARAASTPFTMGAGAKLPALPLSSIKKQKESWENGDEEMAEASSAHSDVQQAQFHTFNTTRVTPNKNDLSPIIEGSTEGSSEESKSQAASSLGASAHALTSLSGVKTPRNQHLANDVEMATVSEVGEPTDQHVIDTSHYVPAEMDDKTEALLSMSVCIDPHNPFDQKTVAGFLKEISPPLEKREGFELYKQCVPTLSNFVNLGLDTYQVIGLIGEGGYAKVYHANSFSSNIDDSFDDTLDTGSSASNDCVIKVQKPAAPWEFYICSEVHQRLQKMGLSNMRSSMMAINKAYFYMDGSCLVSDFCSLGSLLTLVNQVKGQRELMASLEPLAAFVTVHLLAMVESLHACRVIHGDIKPDNILITGFPTAMAGGDREAFFGPGSQCLRLVDFGQAIDMTLYPKGTTFMAKVGTSGFQCIEMMTDQPWTYQTDLFGLVGSLHVLIFGQYMKVYCSKGQWLMNSSFQRKWKVDLWKRLFSQLLNIADCDHQPDLGALRQEFEQHFLQNLAPQFPTIISKVKTTMYKDMKA